MRAQLLEICGYKVDVLEYVDDEGSLKNILIRAKKSTITEEKKQKLLAELVAFENVNHAKLMLHKLLESNKLL